MQDRVTDNIFVILLSFYEHFSNFLDNNKSQEFSQSSKQYSKYYYSCFLFNEFVKAQLTWLVD